VISHLLDASAILAMMLEEPGSERVAEVLDVSDIHPINLTEVAKKLCQRKVERTDIEAALNALDIDGTDWTRQKAYRAGELLAANRAIGLSLGDAVCLIEASGRGLTAVTAEHRWPEIVWPTWPEAERLPRPDILLIR
jgi:ribonuclease VapC